MSHKSTIARAYDALASGYDRELEKDEWIRRALWRRFDRLFHPGDHVLDVGCGTGIDTIHLASRGVCVTAIDASAGMVALLREKAERSSAPCPPVSLVGEINETLAQLPGPFDGIVSSFAALNTVAIDAFAESAARLVRPGGRVICHMLSPGYHGRRLSNWLCGLRTASSEQVAVRLAEHSIVHLNLHPLEIYRRFFAASFEKRVCHAVGLIVTPRIERRLPLPVLTALGEAEALVASIPPLLALGRFFVLDLERRWR